MARRSGQKGKLIALLEILWKHTDEAHPMTLAEIASSLENYGISAERKSLYSDLEILSEFGFEVVRLQGKRHGYYLAERPFELVELKLLVDAVQSSKFITEKKSRELIAKLSSLASRHEGSSLSRQVYVADRIKTMNESIYYGVDEIHRAITRNRKISFQYFSWDLNKNRVLRRGGERYVESPFALLWNDENYYLIAFDDARQKILHFRVDKMLHIELSDECREGEEEFAKIDLSAYIQRVFGMFGGEQEHVTLRLDKSLIGVILDRFGRDVPLLRAGEDAFTVTVPVSVSPQFFGWLASLGAEATLVSPAHVKQDYVRYLADTLRAQE